MEFEHKTFGKCELGDLTQKGMEDFHRAMKGKEQEVLSVWRGDSVRVAAKQGLLVEPKLSPEDINNAKPAKIAWLSECIAKLFAEALNVDPLS
jgi:hypothetical protein